MNNTTNTKNAVLLTVGTGLLILGSETIKTDLVSGAVELVLGIAVYVIYQFTP